MSNWLSMSPNRLNLFMKSQARLRFCLFAALRCALASFFAALRCCLATLFSVFFAAFWACLALFGPR